MSVKTISKDELRRMDGSEGFIIQGCGGSLDEWVDGINDMLTEDGILLDGTRFHDCSTFEHDGSTCLLFPFKDDVKLDVGRLWSWLLQADQDSVGSRRTETSAAHGSRTTFRTGLAVSSQRISPQKKRKSRTAHSSVRTATSSI